MSAEILRRAASLMRERAEGSTSGPWTTYRSSSAAGVEVLGPGRRWVIAAKQFFAPPSEPPPVDIAHIASWHPAVALAVAKAMDDVAHAWEICDDGWTRDADDDCIRFEDTVDAGWVAVARAYLGGDA